MSALRALREAVLGQQVGGVRGSGRPHSAQGRGMVWTLPRKVSAALAALLFSSMVLTALFGFYKFEDLLSAQIGSRYSFVVFTVKKNVEDRMNLGLALRQLRQVQETVEREKARDPNIQGIQIFDTRGEVLFNSDRGRIGGVVPKDWLSALEGPPTQPFALRDEDSLVVGLPLVNNLGKVEGAVALTYPGLLNEARGMLGQLALEWLAIFAVFAILAVFGASMMFREVGQRLDSLGQAMVAAMADGGAVPAATSDDPFESRFIEFAAKARETADHLADATQDVERMDRLV